ncbi:hypothetical protein IJ707_00775 [bacterium]|nr:hypothetical protein [bacterium]
MKELINEKTAKIIYNMYADLQILYFALQSFDDEIELSSIFSVVERLYINADVLNTLFTDSLL